MRLSGRRLVIYLVLITALTGTGSAAAWRVGHTTATPATSTVAAAHVPNEPKALPVRILIPAIAVNADVEPLHRDADGSLQTPRDWSDAGWFADGVTPGDRGPAVIVGHVDSARDGPAVFFRLPELQQGDEVLVQTRNGPTQRFLVDVTRQFPKTEFPTDLVYGPTPLRELRLITCAGSFDRKTGSYSDNLIVTAYAASTPQLR
jgi:sortase (surface protein transpeptidase)